MKLAIVILVVVVLLVLWLAGTYNGLVKKKNVRYRVPEKAVGSDPEFGEYCKGLRRS